MKPQLGERNIAMVRSPELVGRPVVLVRLGSSGAARVEGRAARKGARLEMRILGIVDWGNGSVFEGPTIG